MSRKDLARLIEVLDAGFQAEQGRMAVIGQEISRIQARLAALSVRSGQAGDLGDPATRAGADMRWQAWAEQRRGRLNRDLAELMRQREGLRADLARAFGKLTAAKALRDNITREAGTRTRGP